MARFSATARNHARGAGRVDLPARRRRDQGGLSGVAEATRQKYKYDPVAGWQYRRDQAAQKTRAEQEAAAAAAEPQSVGPAVVEVKDLTTEVLPDNSFRVSFTLKNVTDQAQTVTTTVRDAGRLALISRTIELAPKAATKLLRDRRARDPAARPADRRRDLSDQPRAELVGGARVPPATARGASSVDDERFGVAVVVGVEELIGEGETLLGTDLGARSARDAWGCENAGIVELTGGARLSNC